MLNSRTKNSLLLTFGLWALFFGFAAKSLIYRLIDPDLWWHLAAGREMMKTHLLLRTDIFSHTLYGTPWIDFEWLSQIVLFGITEIAGFWGLIWFRVIFSVSALMILAVLCREKGARGAGLFFLTGAAYWLLRPRFSERPELFTLNFFPLLILLIERARFTAPDRRLKYSFFIALLMLIWANLHGGFVYGLGALSLFVAGSWWADGTARPSEETGFLSKTLALSTLAVVVNPYGVGLVSVFVEHLRQLFFTPHLIDEWKPTGVRSMPFFWITGLFALFFVINKSAWRDPDTRRWLPALLIFGFWGAYSYRNGPLFTFLALPFLAGRMRFPERGWRTVVLFLLPLLSLGHGVTAPVPGDPVQWRLLPQGACVYIQKNNLRGTLGHDYGYGGYISWALGPEQKIMMDGRYIFYPLIQDIERATAPLLHNSEDPAWPKLLDDRRIDTVITVFNDTPLQVENVTAAFPLTVLNLFYPRSRWALVYWDDTALIFLKRTPANDSFIRDHEYKSLYPYNLPQMKFLLAAKTLSLDAVKRELDRHQQETGFCHMEKVLRAELGADHVAGT